MTGEYAAFISYRHRPLDTMAATRLHRLIEHYRIPKDLRQDGEKHVGRVFRDRDELPLSSDLTAELRAALDHSKFLIVICTPDTPQSIWVDREIEYFLRSHDRDNVLAVLAAGTQDAAFPKRLTEVYAADGVTVVEQVEPLAANIADETNPITPANRLLPHRLRVLWRLHSEFLRLMAALLHCPYDALRQRQRQYVLRRVLAATVAAAGVIAVFAGMLLNRNREIARQMTLAQQNAFTAQKNESYALGLLSAQQMADGDRIAAIETALDGLPAADEGRPVHAAAEQALADALYLYRPAALRPAGTIKTDYDIETACLNDDGSRLLLLDDYARTVYCYDTASTRLLWSTKLDNVLTQYGYTAFVPWQDGQEAFLYAFSNEVELLDMNTGQVLADWNISKPAEGFDIVSSCAVLPDGRTLAAVYQSLPGAEGLLLVTWDLWTGERQSTLALPYGGPMYMLDASFVFDYNVFTEESTYWALLVQDNDTANECGWQAAYAGLLDGMTLTWQQQYPDLTHYNSLCGLFDDPGELVLVHTDGFNAGDPLWVDRFDVDSGTQDYSNAGALPWSIDFNYPPLLYKPDARDPVLSLNIDALLFLDTGVCHINTFNGDLLPQPSLDGAALCACPDGSSGFFVVQANGMVAQVPRLNVYSYGYEVLHRTAPALRAATAAGGSAAFALLPEEDRRAVWLYRLLGDDEYRLLPMPAQEQDQTDPAGTASLFPLGTDGQLTMRKISADGDVLCLYDAQMQTVQAFSSPSSSLPYDLRPFGLTGDGLLLCTTSTDAVGLWLDTASGQLYTLTGLLPKTEQADRGPVTPPGGTTPWFAWLAKPEGTDADGPAFTLRYALDPRQAQQAPQPEGVRPDGSVLAIGGSGWAVTTGTLVQDGSTCWAAFDTAAGQWQTVAMPEAAVGSTNLCVGDALPCFAALEQDGTCRLYDLAAGTASVLAQLPGIDAPAQTVLRFADADRVLLAFLPDGALYVLDTETGAVRLTVELPDLPEPFCPLVQVDESGRDLYIADPSGALPGLCIDLEDWYLKWRREDFLCWLPASRELAFRSSEYSEGYAPRLYPVPDVSELAARARALLAS